jgi:hypothetical protein
MDTYINNKTYYLKKKRERKKKIKIKIKDLSKRESAK